LLRSLVERQIQRNWTQTSVAQAAIQGSRFTISRQPTRFDTFPQVWVRFPNLFVICDPTAKAIFFDEVPSK